MSDDAQAGGPGLSLEQAILRFNHGGDPIPLTLAGSALATKRIDEWLGTMETHAGTWGGPESIELQFLNLVEIRQMMRRPMALSANPYETRDAYIQFIGKLFGGLDNRPLFCNLRDHDALDQLPTLLGDFGRWMAREYPAEVSR